MYLVESVQTSYNVMSFITERDIDALIDNELSEERASTVLSEIEHMPHLKSYYKEMLVQKALLQDWWAQLGRRQN
ncbi:MAG: hypothetical protein AB7E85_01505 [Pseudobdellovibrionaceae bacterium]